MKLVNMKIRYWPQSQWGLKTLSYQLLTTLLIFCTFSLSAQVSGTIIDNEGETLIGVNVLVKGTTTGTVTDFDGRYALDAPSDATLVFSYTGYRDQEVAVGNRTIIDVTMATDVAVLDEVVVIGYGTQRKVDLTGAVGSIGAEEIAKTPILSADQALRGRVAGVQLTNRSGDPGAPINVRIRGVGTTGNNSPLYVIDGVPIVQTTNITVNTASNTESNPLAGINPSDIESIDILKDASSAAIYGTRAANGVVIITTKRGKSGRTSLTYDGYVGVQNVRAKHDVLGVADYIALQSEIGNDFSAFNGRPFVDWQEEVFSSASMQNHSLTASGGTENANFNISGGYFSQDGISLATGFKRYSVKANSDIKVGKRIRVGESLNVSFTDRLVESEPGRAAAFGAARNSPFTPVRENGAFTVFNADNSGAAASSNSQVVGLNDLSNNETRVLSRRILGSIYGEIEIADGLKFRTQAGVDYNIGEGSWLQNIYNFGSASNTGILQVVSKPTELTTNITNTLSYNKSFNGVDLNILLGHEETNFEFDRLRGQGRGFLSDAVTLVNTAATSAVGQERDNWALRGYMGRANFVIQNKYLVTATVRRDESSRFTRDNRSAVFPSFSVGWKLSEESFLADNSAIDELKIRAGWGQAGNQFTSNSFAYLSTLGLTSLYVLGTGQTIEAAPTPFTFANPNLRWETSTQIDIGVDLRLWEGKLETSLDYYQKNTTDILVGLPISAISGFLLPPDVNSGEIENKGIEFSATYRDRVGDFNYSISGNLTTNDNEVISLGENPNPIITGFFGAQTHRTTVGLPIGHFFGYETDGIYQTQAEVDAALPDVSGSPSPGDIRFVDVDGDGSITPADRTFLGNSTPRTFFGINLGADYKGLDISLFFQGVGGVKVFNNVTRSLTSMNSTSNQSTLVLDRWTGQGTSTTIPRATIADPNGNNRFSDRFVEDASYFRFQNLQIGYTINQNSLQDFADGFVQNIRFYIAASNLFTLTNYTGLDPEVTRGFSFQKGEMPLSTGQDDGATPTPRVFQFGVRATF